MPDNTNITDLRLQLLNNGYSPIPNKDKACYVKNWPKMATDAAAIKKWGRSRSTKGTGIRVENGLCVIDIDIDHEDVNVVIPAMIQAAPGVEYVERLERSGKGHKLAWYVRCNELFTRLHTRRWTAPGEADLEDERTHSVEIFGGASPRQFGSFGPHTINELGETEIEYTWADETPADVPLADLPLVTKAQLFAMLDAAEAALIKRDFEAVERSTGGEGVPKKVYDITDDMTFDLLSGETVTTADLEDMVEGGWEGRCSASWMGDTSPNRTRCIVRCSPAGELQIWETSTGDTHMHEDLGPSKREAALSKLHTGLASLVRELPEEEQRRINEAQATGALMAVGPDDIEDDGVDGAYDSEGNPTDDAPRGGMVYAERPDLRLSLGDNMDEKVGKLLSAYGFLEGAGKPVIPLWRYEGQATNLCMSVASLRELCMPYREEGEPGPRGGKPPMINPADVWLCSVRKKIVHGARVRVDKPLPTYKEGDGTTWVNAYCPVDFGSAEGGSEDTILEFIEHLLPDDDELDYFMKWLAYKFQNPAIPGPAVVMVAREYGTGRGTLTKLITKLFGIRMVARVDFARFAGMNYQAQYTSWACGKLFAVVDESPAATVEVSSYQARADIYERLKEVIEPAPTLREYIFKGTTDQEVVQLSAMTSLIMTNNANAIPLPENDRRISVLTNGEAGSAEFWERMGCSLDHAPDVAAFAEYLRQYDTADYSPYVAPPMTEGKKVMSQLNKTALDRCIAEALSKMVGPFHMTQAINHMARYSSVQGMKLPDAWKAIAERDIAAQAYPVRGKKYRHTSIMIDGRTCPIYAKSRAEAKTLSQISVKDYRAEIDENNTRALGDGEAVDMTTQGAASPVVVNLKR